MVKPALLLTLYLPLAILGCAASQSTVVPNIEAIAAQPSSQKASSTEGEDVRDGAAVLRELASDPSLHLSTAKDTEFPHFHFLSRVISQMADGRERMANVTVVRDEMRVAMLCTSATGLPYCYATNNFFVSLDPSRAGGLILFHGGSPSFTLSVAPETNQLIYQFSYFGHQANPSIDLDLPAFLRATQATLRSATFDQLRRTIEARTANAVVLITLSDRSRPPYSFLVTDFLMESRRTHNMVMIGGITTDSAPPFDMTSEASVRKLGLPVRNLTANDVRTIDLMVPLDFGKNPAERHAAERLRELIGPALPSPRSTIRIEADSQTQMRFARGQ